jgi:hypothetical protein
MQVLIDNKDLTDYGIEVLDYTGAFSFAAERENEREWADKSGVDKNLVNIKYDTKEFVLHCMVKANDEGAAYDLVKVLVNDMFSRGCVVLSLRDTAKSIRECYLVERSGTLIADINIREQNSLYFFKLGLKDVNPNAVKYNNTITGNSTTINYTKGQTAVIYWGNGERAEVSNSGNYTKDDYAADGEVDIIIDVDADAATITALSADFSASPGTTGDKPFTVDFTDDSTGDIIIWNWNFGDGNTSDEQNPTHEYEESGTYTVTLQVFNDAQGSDTEQKIDYITVVPVELGLDDTDVIGITATDQISIN